jgi:hypothetical protein
LYYATCTSALVCRGKNNAFIVDAKATFYERYTHGMIDKSFTEFAINDMKAEIKTISNGVSQIKNSDLSDDDRKLEVKILFHSCNKILLNFEEHDHIFYQQPPITAPYLITFSQLYLSTIEVGVILMYVNV